MSTLILSSVGQAIGTAVAGPFGGLVGRALGAVAGAAIDSQLLSSGSGTRLVEGPRLKEMDGLSSTEGAGIPRVYGRARIGGQLIWATAFEEQIATTIERGGGGKGGGAQKTISTSYSYFANIAVGLCEGPIAFVRRVWADGKELDLTTVTMRVHRGHPGQAADPLILAKEAGEAPAYSGLAYVVFERLALAAFGNRVPQLAFEVVRAVPGLNEQVRAVTLIPGAGEFVYAIEPVAEILGIGASSRQNRHQLQGGSDVEQALDHLQALCPGLTDVALVVSWFGDDLRAGDCTLAPRVELNRKQTLGADWQVAGLSRLDARAVSQRDGRPALGGTPSDASVMALIRALKLRGLRVLLYPFILMDIAAGNSLPSPYGGSGQAAYPWRGRISCMPAPGQPGSPDGSAAVRAQIAAFAGTVARGDFSAPEGQVVCARPGEWRYRRMILHYAQLAQAAGGVDAFLIGSELIGLTRVRDGSGYPFVDALVTLADDVGALLGPGTQLSYAADWTEYGAHVRNGGADVAFPLDPLWASQSIDAIGIDYYPPLSDWRDGAAHADAALFSSGVDEAYLRARVTSGEAYDWSYADAAGRLVQNRLPISDGSYGKPWLYRAKDIAGWWSHPHLPRSGRIESTTPTGFVPGSKPVWLTEFGVPAVDKAANAPNVFPDPKSAEAGLPPFSTGARDDLAQARALSAVLSVLDPASPHFQPAANPVRAAGGRMIDPSRIYLWSWDARPFPAFPEQASTWSDAPNWEVGHWLSGRLEGTPLDRLIAAILADFNLPEARFRAVDGFCDGYVIDRPMSARDAIEPLLRLFGVDGHFDAEGLSLSGRRGVISATLDRDMLVPDRDGSLFSIRRGEENDMPREVRLAFADGEKEYRRATSLSRMVAGGARREVNLDTAVVTRSGEAQRLADARLQEAWAGREVIICGLSPRAQEVEPGDVVLVELETSPRLYRIQTITDGARRTLTAPLVEPGIYLHAPVRGPDRRPVAAPVVGSVAYARAFDLPALPNLPGLAHLAITATPWPGIVPVLRRTGSGTFTALTIARRPATLGVTLGILPPGVVWRWDRHTTLDVRLAGTGLASISNDTALAGGNAMAIRGADGRVEVLVAARAELIAPSTWRLGTLLRGLAGTEDIAARSLPAGADVVLLDDSLVAVTDRIEDRGQTLALRVVPGSGEATDPLGIDVTALVSARSLMPLAPVHPRMRRTGTGVVFSWIRRTRIDGDAWESAEVPLGEASEAYRLRLLDAAGGAVRHEVMLQQPGYTYPPGQEILDFGAVQSRFYVELCQFSQAVGPGLPLVTRLDFV